MRYVQIMYQNTIFIAAINVAINCSFLFDIVLYENGHDREWCKASRALIAAATAALDYIVHTVSIFHLSSLFISSSLFFFMRALLCFNFTSISSIHTAEQFFKIVENKRVRFIQSKIDSSRPI